MKAKYNRYEDVLVHVGKRIRERRIALGMRQVDLAEKMGYKFPQAIHTTEKGTNDIGLSRLFDYAKVLDCNLEYLIFDQEPWAREPSPEEALGKAPVTILKEASQEVFELIAQKKQIEIELEEAMKRLEDLTNKTTTEY